MTALMGGFVHASGLAAAALFCMISAVPFLFSSLVLLAFGPPEGRIPGFSLLTLSVLITILFSGQLLASLVYIRKPFLEWLLPVLPLAWSLTWALDATRRRAKGERRES